MIIDRPPTDHCLASRACAREEALGELCSLNTRATATRHAERAQQAFNAGDYAARAQCSQCDRAEHEARRAEKAA